MLFGIIASGLFCGVGANMASFFSCQLHHAAHFCLSVSLLYILKQTHHFFREDHVACGVFVASNAFFLAVVSEIRGLSDPQNHWLSTSLSEFA